MSVDALFKERLRLIKLAQKEDDSSIRSTPSFKGSSPPITRLPRATRTTQARENAARKKQQQGSNVHGNLSSSESSSRNSSPLTGNRRLNISAHKETAKIGNGPKGKTGATNGVGGSPSLRRSLLMAARVPQKDPASHIPQSPLQPRRSSSKSTIPVSTSK